MAAGRDDAVPPTPDRASARFFNRGVRLVASLRSRGVRREVHMEQLDLVPYLLYEKENNGILWIKFNRPEKLNAAVGGAERTGTLAKVGEYMRAADDDPDVKVIVLTGVGRGFCAGVDVRGTDLGEFEPNDNSLGNAPYETGGLDETRQRFYYGITKLMKDISYVRKPTIAMINGVAAGFGMDMALQCDIRYGSENTRFISYQQVGQIIENGGAYYLTRLAGLGRALEFSFTRPPRRRDRRGVGRLEQARSVR